MMTYDHATLTLTLNGNIVTAYDIKVTDGQALSAGPPMRLDRTFTYESSFTLSRREWKRIRRAMREPTGDILPLGILGGRRAVAIDRRAKP